MEKNGEINIYLNNNTRLQINNGVGSLHTVIYSDDNNSTLEVNGIEHDIVYTNTKKNTYVSVSDYYEEGINYIPKVYKINEKSKQKIREKYDIYDDYDIAGGTIININGKSQVVYWIRGEGKDDFKMFVNNTHMIEEQINYYPPNATDRVIKSGNFHAILVGPLEAIKRQDPNDFYLAAFAVNNYYMYVVTNKYDFNKDSSIFHEFSHMLDCTMGDGELYFSQIDSEMSDLFEKNRTEIYNHPELVCNDYCVNPDGIPNEPEFFATLTQLYLTRPDDLKILLPDCYEYMDTIFNNM